MNEGYAVLIFVTEDFSQSKQVKLDHPEKAKADAVNVMKLNAVRKFNTGIYQYATMSSVFTPVNINEFPNSLKVVTSTQEWCGQTFVQLNLNKNQYHGLLRSYFESEGDKNFELQKTLLEDEVWNKIRLDPENLPTGKIDIIPGTLFARLRHLDLKVMHATATLSDGGDGTESYTLNYDGVKRVLTFHFEKSFPHAINGWEETYESGFGSKAKVMTTKATLMKRIKTDYWNKNHVDDAHWRKDLELPW